MFKLFLERSMINFVIYFSGLKYFVLLNHFKRMKNRKNISSDSRYYFLILQRNNIYMYIYIPRFCNFPIVFH